MSSTLIVAATLANGIGQNSRLPWRLPLEMAYFARVTSSAPDGFVNAVIMGRNTWESIPMKFKPLPRRINIVISRNEDYTLGVSRSTPASAFLRTNLQSAISHASDVTAHATGIHRTFVIGGASVYAEALGLSTHASSQTTPPSIVDRILLTRILHPAFEECDVFMPEFRSLKTQDGELAWQQASHEELLVWTGANVPSGTQEEKGIQYEFQMWVRRF